MTEFIIICMTEFIIICAIAVVAGLLTFITLTLNSISRDLFRIRKILDDHEREEEIINMLNEK